jgi:hypothetical protein
MDYRCEARSIEGFIQQLAVAYVARGYWFYVTGKIPSGKDPRGVDAKLIEKYRFGVSKWARARRKRAGFANLQYLRFEDFFVLLATDGCHLFCVEEAPAIRDVRETPLKFAGYSISHRGGHACVRIEQNTFNELKAYLLDHAVHRSKEHLESAFSRLEFEPYAPIRGQLLIIFRAVNERRKAAGFKPLSRSCLRLFRRPVRPFDDGDEREPIKPVARQPLRGGVNTPWEGGSSLRSGPPR